MKSRVCVWCLLCLIMVPGCSLLQPAVHQLVTAAHQVAVAYCSTPDLVRAEVRAQFTADQAKGPWVQVNCEAL